MKDYSHIDNLIKKIRKISRYHVNEKVSFDEQGTMHNTVTIFFKTSEDWRDDWVILFREEFINECSYDYSKQYYILKRLL